VVLTADDRGDIEQALDEISIQGDRYNETTQQMIDR
jgi:hypothetical protein